MMLGESSEMPKSKLTVVPIEREEREFLTNAKRANRASRAHFLNSVLHGF